MKKLLNKLFKSNDGLISEYQRSCNRSQALGQNFIQYKEYHLTPEQVSKVKNIALYLPQFHSIPENDEWWGKNFTEWNNVAKAIPQYVGQNQPQLPVDMGFYDLLSKKTWQQQIEMAKNYGIYGFCYYFYWFNGRRILEKPIDLFLENADLDMPFCYFWANDSWVRTWHGFSDFEQGDRVLLEQKHNPEDDINVMEYLCKNVFSDKRYIKVDNKPLFIVYHTYLFTNMQETIKKWREICKIHGFNDILIMHVMMPDQVNVKPSDMGFDAAMQFAPIASHREKLEIEVLNHQFKGEVFSYEKTVISEVTRKFSHQSIARGCFMAWDNEARRPTKGISYAGSNPLIFSKYLQGMTSFAKENKICGESFVFINAWNEWAEGAHLEPDREYGYAWLDVIAKIVEKQS